MKSKRHKQAESLLKHLLKLTEADKILNTFIPAFQHKSIDRGGYYFLQGNFNLGFVRSGRLSSSDPNLQNIPSTGNVHAKTIKACIEAPPGFVLVGADYSSLEDRISALQTKDPNKLKVYEDGYDGHCLRAFAYFSDQMPDIDPDDVNSINSIDDKYPDLRQKSKTPTFAMTYQGKTFTLENQGFTPDEARQIYDAYHELYKVSDEWVQERLVEAAQRGYAELAFGLRLHTPLLRRVIVTAPSSMPHKAQAEMRSVGNALTQSYGLLNNESANNFMARVWEHYPEDVFPIAQIHDSQYYLLRNDLSLLKWVNDNLIDCMETYSLPELQHDKVKLEADLEVYYPDLSRPIRLPKQASLEQLKTSIANALD